MKPNFPQLIGYWGHGYTIKLETLLKANSPTQAIRKQKSQATSEPLWGIAYVSVTQISDSNFSISASGQNSADVWVEMEGDNLILGRGIFGRVTLYWTKIEQVIWFASRLQLLLPLIATPQVDIDAVYGYSCFSYVPTPLTPIAGIQALPPGKQQIWSNPDQFETKHLHKWESNRELIRDETEAIAQLQTKLKNALETQLENLSSFSVGVFLSGGLDSAIVAALLVQAGVKVKAYSLDFGPYGVSELPYAQQIATHLQIPLVPVDATPKAITKALHQTVRALDLPFGDGVSVPLYLLSQAASQETEIVFNGENGDQLFAGWTNKPLIAASVYSQQTDFIEQYLHTFHRIYGLEKGVFPPEIISSLPHPSQWLAEALDPHYTKSLLDRLRRANLMLKGAQNIQPRATNIAFANGLRVRSPFCDLALSEFTFQLPGELFLRGATEKYILKKAVESLLPAEIVWREKRGMGVPLTQWFVKPLWNLIAPWLNPLTLQQEGIFLPELPSQTLLGRLGGKIQGRRIGEILWLLMMWELWRYEYLSTPKFNIHLNPFWMPYSLWKLTKNLDQNY